MIITALILVAGIEIGFAITPFGPFAPNEAWRVALEIFIITPILALTAWWYLAYIRFISFQLSATQVGKIFSPWKSWFMKTALALWVLFLIPGLFLARYLSGELLEVFLYFSLIWCASTFLLSAVTFVASWAIINYFSRTSLKSAPTLENSRNIRYQPLSCANIVKACWANGYLCQKKSKSAMTGYTKRKNIEENPNLLGISPIVKSQTEQ
jgi:hypothetical protein